MARAVETIVTAQLCKWRPALLAPDTLTQRGLRSCEPPGSWDDLQRRQLTDRSLRTADHNSSGESPRTLRQRVPALRASPSTTRASGEDGHWSELLCESGGDDRHSTVMQMAAGVLCVGDANSTGLMFPRTFEVVGRFATEATHGSGSTDRRSHHPPGKVPGHYGRECQP
jgi:hypothetical protein